MAPVVLVRKKMAIKPIFVIFLFFFCDFTVSRSKGHIQAHVFRALWISQTYEYFTLSASDGVCQLSHAFFHRLRSVFGSAPEQILPGCLLPYFPLLSRDTHHLIERCFQRMDLRARSMVVRAAKCWGEDGHKSQEAQLWLLQTQLSQMGWICSQVATVSSVYTICSCGSSWFGFKMAHHPGKQGSAATGGLLQIWFVCVRCSCSSTFLAFLFGDVWVILHKPIFPVQSGSRDFLLIHRTRETAFCKNLTMSGRNTHVSHLMLHSCHLHGHIQRKRRVFNGVSECQTCARRPVVEKAAIVGVGSVPAGAALVSLLWFSPPDPENRLSVWKKTLVYTLSGCGECVMSHTQNIHVHWR